MFNDGGVCAGSRSYRLAREYIGVDDGEGVWRRGENVGDGGLAGSNGAGEANEKHGE